MLRVSKRKVLNMVMEYLFGCKDVFLYAYNTYPRFKEYYDNLSDTEKSVIQWKQSAFSLQHRCKYKPGSEKYSRFQEDYKAFIENVCNITNDDGYLLCYSLINSPDSCRNVIEQMLSDHEPFEMPDI